MSYRTQGTVAGFVLVAIVGALMWWVDSLHDACQERGGILVSYTCLRSDIVVSLTN